LVAKRVAMAEIFKALGILSFFPIFKEPDFEFFENS
jgi:hypothetical protein